MTFCLDRLKNRHGLNVVEMLEPVKLARTNCTDHKRKRCGGATFLRGLARRCFNNLQGCLKVVRYFYTLGVCRT
jgi:hypothetical protein